MIDQADHGTTDHGINGPRTTFAKRTGLGAGPAQLCLFGRVRQRNVGANLIKMSKSDGAAAPKASIQYSVFNWFAVSR
jgi:hypothetical protein